MSGDLLSARAAAAKLGVSPTTFRRWVREGVIPAWYGPGRRWPLYSAPELDDILATLGRDQRQVAS